MSRSACKRWLGGCWGELQKKRTGPPNYTSRWKPDADWAELRERLERSGRGTQRPKSGSKMLSPRRRW